MEMAYNFPDAPINGQEFTPAGGVTYVYNTAGTCWNVKPAPAGPSPGAAAPLMNGTAAAGSATAYSREDHVHPTDTTRLSKAGGPMTGGITITTTDPAIVLNKGASGQKAIITGQMNTSARWTVEFGNTDPETGSNAGSNFQISRYSDANAFIGGALVISRSSGLALFSNDIQNQLGSHRPPSGADGGFGMKAGDTNVANAAYFNLDYASSNVYMTVNKTYVGQLAFVSDYRIKKDVAPLPSMWSVVKALKPIKYTLRDYTPASEQANATSSGKPFVAGDDIERWGFIAHELQETMVASAATGAKDQANMIQSPNPFTVIAALTKALQEAMTRIEALEAKVP
jgi:Chaperone of endosialidase